MSLDYIHGYSAIEQERLIQQAQYWQDRLILRDLNYCQGKSLLEIGCGARAVLGILGKAFPGLKLAGIDREAKQINYARQYLQSLNLTDVDLRLGDASQLPWQDNTFDYIYGIWFLEHVNNPKPILDEAYPVLKPGGTITLTETDYRTIAIYPDLQDYNYLRNSLSELLFAAGGNPYIGQNLATVLSNSCFKKVSNIPFGFHYSNSTERNELSQFIDYIYAWLEPTKEEAIAKLAKDPERLSPGLEFFRTLPEHPEGAITAIIYRATAVK